jgi:effector-binding domain-containing protein
VALPIYPAIVFEIEPKGKIEYTITHMNLTDEQVYKHDDKITFEINKENSKKIKMLFRGLKNI